MDLMLSAMIGLGFVAVIFTGVWFFAPKGWRTAWFNGVTGVGAIAAPITEHIAKTNWETVTDPETAFFVVQGATLGNIVWRVKTTTPIGKPD